MLRRNSQTIMSTIRFMISRTTRSLRSLSLLTAMFLPRYLSALVFTIGLSAGYANASSFDNIQTISKAYLPIQQSANTIFAADATTFQQLAPLVSVCNAASERKQPQHLAALVTANQRLLIANISKPAVLQLIEQLLNLYLKSAADPLINAALATFDPYVEAKAHYYLANYYFSLGDYDKVAAELGNIEVENALTADERAYSTILYGITLQKQKQHRKAISYYEKVESSSRYYSYAQLNRAVAFIRQGWWTDAQLAIENALKQDNSELGELNNRLLVVLGFSQLRYEFYRDARVTFRKISLGSEYENPALLGLGLAALHQGDYIGSLNAFKRLKEKPFEDIYVIESRLLIAFVHEQMKQLANASALYSEAIVYYQTKQAEAKQRSVSIRLAQRQSNTDLVNSLPPYIKADISPILFDLGRDLSVLKAKVDDKKLQMEADELLTQVNTAINTEAQILIDSHQEKLTSYLSQAQYGVAKLLDTES